MALTNRYTGIARGAMVLTGNTVTTRLNIALPPATGNQIFEAGTYITTQNLQVPGYPVGTTLKYIENSSMAILNVLPNSTVLFAQLMWTFRNTPPGIDNNPVTFTTPAGATSVPPTLNDVAFGINWRAADVKALVQAGIDTQPTNGQYTVAQIPSIDNPTNTVVSVTWGLIVVYENATFPFRYFNVNSGAAEVSAFQQLTFNFTNFATPNNGPIKGYLLMSYTDGDIKDNAQLRVGVAAPGTQIGNASYPWDTFAPYSRINNMFPADILIADTQDPNIGLLDTRGTFGNLNVDPYGNGGTGSAPAAARNSYDIAGYDISSQLVNGQTNLYTNITFGGGTGSAASNSQSVQLDINSADIKISKTVDMSFVYIGDSVLYTITMNNIGVVDAQNVVLTDIVPPGFVFETGSVVIGVTPSPSDDPNAGIPIGTITASGGTQTVTFKATANSVPAINPAVNSATVDYEFESVQGQPLIPAKSDSNDASTLVLPALDINVQIALSAAPPTVGLGDDINYTTNICNLSSRTITDCTFLCQLPEGTEFVQDSFTINGVLQPGANPFKGVFLVDLIPQQCVTLGFKVRYIAKTCCEKIGCYCTLNFNYKDNPTTPIVNRTIKSNMVYTNKVPNVMII